MKRFTKYIREILLSTEKKNEFQAQVLNVVNSQITDPKGFEELASSNGCFYSGIQGPIHPRIVVICIVGGISYSEISALRLIEKAAGIRLVIASDSMLTGNKIMQYLENA